ncbi:MAG: outer membrane beta-barrel protein [Elainella sp. C42_A2020_010]|nr:outer membrane beta-barrel protein [Elainella sp. C42_A2020_010]
MIRLKFAALSFLSLLTVAPTVLSGQPASAQAVIPRGMDGSYLGGGVSVGVSNPDDDDAILGGNVQGRLDLPTVPISVRGAALFNGDNAALMPLVTYDLGVAPNTNLYVGGGYSFTVNDDASPLGNQNAPVITAGVETAIQRNLALYGDAKVGIDAFKDSNDTAVSVQVGAAYRF